MNGLYARPSDVVGAASNGRSLGHPGLAQASQSVRAISLIEAITLSVASEFLGMASQERFEGIVLVSLN